MARSAMTMGTGGKIAEQLSVGVLAQIYPWGSSLIPVGKGKIRGKVAG